MKRFFAATLLFALFLCTAGCAADTPGASTALPSPEVSVPVQEANDWGISLTLKDLTRTGATIVCTQSGGISVSEINTGSFFILEKLTESGWQEVEQRNLEGDLAWTMEAWIVNLNGTTEWTLNWEWLYGELPDGHYRLGKEFMNFRGPGDYDKMMVYTFFGFGTPDK